MTTQEMMNRVAFLIDDNSGKNYAATDLLQSLNVGQANVAKEFVNLGVGWFEQAADLNPSNPSPGTVPGVELYSLPTDFDHFIRVERSDTGSPLHLIPMNEKVLSGTVNTPIANIGSYNYFVTGNYLGINPVPQTSIPLRMWYVYLLPALALVTDVSQIKANWHDMVCVSAAMDFVIKDEADASQLSKKYDRYIIQLHQTEGARSTQEPRSVSQYGGSYGY